MGDMEWIDLARDMWQGVLKEVMKARNFFVYVKNCQFQRRNLFHLVS